MVAPLSSRANGSEYLVVCQPGKENEEGVKIIPAQIYAGVDTGHHLSLSLEAWSLLCLIVLAGFKV